MPSQPSRHLAIRPEWLASRHEDPLDPDRMIVDAHHHLYDRPGHRYLFEDMLEDIASGHNVRATVHVQARSMYRTSGAPEMRSVGETEFANGVAAMSESGLYGDARVCAAIVGYADLLDGEAVRPVLEAHIAAGGGSTPGNGRFRGIRQTAVWDPDPSIGNPAYPTTPDMLETDQFRSGFAQLAPLGLSFDAWVLFHQIPRLTQLARDFPDTQIVLNHCGGVMGSARFKDRRDEIFPQWSAALADLAQCSNVAVKIGGLGMGLSGFEFAGMAQAPSSQMLADAWRPWVETVIETFGPERAMFESNFPVDKGSYSYCVGWNGFKRIAAPLDNDEQDHLFWRSAARVYRIEHVLADQAPSQNHNGKGAIASLPKDSERRADGPAIVG